MASEIIFLPQKPLAIFRLALYNKKTELKSGGIYEKDNSKYR